MYKITNQRTQRVLVDQSDVEVAAALLEVCGGNLMESRVEAMRLAYLLRDQGVLSVSTLLIELTGIPVDTMVRSYDFPHTDDYYVEGVIVESGALDNMDGQRYKIAVQRWVVEGNDAANYTDYVYPLISDRVQMVEHNG